MFKSQAIWFKSRPNSFNKTRKLNYGTHQANRSQEHRIQSTKEAAGQQGCKEDRQRHWQRCQEAPQIQTWNSCSQRNQKVLKVNWALDPQVALPTSGQRDRPRVQVRPPFPVAGSVRTSGGSWGLHGRLVWRHESLRDPCQACDHHAQGHPTCSSHPRWTCLSEFKSRSSDLINT